MACGVIRRVGGAPAHSHTQRGCTHALETAGRRFVRTVYGTRGTRGLFLDGVRGCPTSIQPQLILACRNYLGLVYVLCQHRAASLAVAERARVSYDLPAGYSGRSHSVYGARAGEDLSILTLWT